MVGSMKDKSILKNQKGQALFELIIFMPFLVFLFTIFYTIGNSISGSINQQKAVRGYFYTLMKNNSYVNTAKEVDEFVAQNSMRQVGFSAVGWREKAQGNRAIAPCFKFNSMLKDNSSSETCEGKDRGDSDSGPTSSFVRIFTFYGICGPVYTIPDGSPRMGINPSLQNNPAGCILE